MDGNDLPIIDCHQHLYDAGRMRYPVFEIRSAGFEALLGDYSALPRVYLPEHYARDAAGLNVVKTVWAEFMSEDPVGEVKWAAKLAKSPGRPDGVIALADFSSPDLTRTLEVYAATGHVRCVRQHLAWHPTNALLRYAARSNILSDPDWRRGIGAIRNRDFACEIEVFSTQLWDFASVAAAFPDIEFILPVMGWPVDISGAGRAGWKRGLIALAACENVAVKIFGLECVFGIDWTVDEVRPWILETIETFGPDRCMFASHMPITRLAGGMRRLYEAYFDIIRTFSASERRQLLHDTAARVYRL